MSALQRVKLDEFRSVASLPMLKFYTDSQTDKKSRDASLFVKKVYF